MSRSAVAGWWRPGGAAGSWSGHANPVAGARDPGSPVTFWALMSFTFILLIAPQTWFPMLSRLRIAMLSAAAAVLAHVLDRTLRRAPLFRLDREAVVSLGLVGWAVVTIPLSYWPGGSLAFLLDRYLKTLVIFWLLGNALPTLGRIRQICWALSLLSVPLAVTGVANFLGGAFAPGGVHRDVKRIVGYEAPLTENPNDLALMLNLILPFSVAHFRNARGALPRAAAALIGMLGAAAVVLTFSRAGFLTLATLAALYVSRFLRRGKWGAALAVVLLGVLCLPFLPAGYVGHLGTITDIESDPTGSAQARWGDMAAAAKVVAAHPVFGAGLGMNLVALNAERGPAWKAVHNVYLEYALELGIPGLGLFLLLFTGSVGRARRVRREGSGAGDPSLRQAAHLAEAVEISLLGFGVAAMFHPVGYHFYFYYLAGLAAALSGACGERGARIGDPGGAPELRLPAPARG